MKFSTKETMKSFQRDGISFQLADEIISDTESLIDDDGSMNNTSCYYEVVKSFSFNADNSQNDYIKYDIDRTVLIAEDVVLRSEQGFIKSCSVNNEKELRRAYNAVNYWIKYLSGNNNNDDLKTYLDKIIEIVEGWFISNGMEIPIKNQLEINENIKSEPEKSELNKVDQVDFIDKFRAACRDKKLTKGNSIPVEVLYQIGKEICFNEMPKSIKTFKDGNKIYHKLRQYASITEYKKGRKTKT